MTSRVIPDLVGRMKARLDTTLITSPIRSGMKHSLQMTSVPGDGVGHCAGVSVGDDVGHGDGDHISTVQ